jgi:aminoglycoside phosphotransferase (APT) family kinase protein
VPDQPTSALLLETLRDVTGRRDLEFVAPPTPLSGGFYAEMLRFRLADPPAELDRELVARIVPNPAAGEWEATIQRAVADQGFPTPSVRLVGPASGPLGRYLIVMDAIDGRPPMAGLGIGTLLRQIPSLMRGLPDQLAHLAARLHSLETDPLVGRLEALDGGLPTTTVGFVEQQIGRAAEAGRADLATAGARLVESASTTTAHASGAMVIAHGDLHPFNVLVTADGPVLIDWTVARVAHPAFTIAFTELMLANPPIAVPRPVDAVLGRLGRNLARRFVATYRALTDDMRGAVDRASLDWHGDVHALRILVELAVWDAQGTRPPSGHPWLVLEPIASRRLLA